MKSRSAYLVLGIGLVLVAAWLGMLLWNAGVPTAAVGGARPGPPAHYVLTDTQGHVITERSFPGRLRLVFVGFASCADVCPATLAKFRPALAALGEDADRVQPLFISVDPDSDTPERLARYVQAFDARILGATGSPAQLRGRAQLRCVRECRWARGQQHHVLRFAYKQPTADRTWRHATWCDRQRRAAS
jgi:cytochrome oxidase Cu insertion factor (SCO1/SenC/PrrC family)